MSSERELISLYARAVSETVSEHFREARAHEDDWRIERCYFNYVIGLE